VNSRLCGLALQPLQGFLGTHELPGSGVNGRELRRRGEFGLRRLKRRLQLFLSHGAKVGTPTRDRKGAESDGERIRENSRSAAIRLVGTAPVRRASRRHMQPMRHLVRLFSAVVLARCPAPRVALPTLTLLVNVITLELPPPRPRLSRGCGRSGSARAPPAPAPAAEPLQGVGDAEHAANHPAMSLLPRQPAQPPRPVCRGGSLSLRPCFTSRHHHAAK
jgi:hypothetical protein